MGKKMPLSKLISGQDELRKLRLASFPLQNPNPVMELDAVGRIEFANQAALKKAKELGLKDVSGLLPKDIKKIIKSFQAKKQRQVYREINLKGATLEESIHWASQFNAVRVFIRDITRRKRAEEKLIKINEELEEKVQDRTNELAELNELLSLSNRATSRQNYMDSAVQFIKKWSGCAFVGIRILQKEEFIPYESYTGFSNDFWQSENMLSLKKDQCACIRVIAGKPDTQDRSAMTQAGSFYTNDSAGFVAGLTEKEQARFRGKCIRCGFDSIAIIPIRRRETVLGAVHIADKKPGLLPLKKIETLESLAVLIGEAVNKFNAQERLIESYKHLGFINRKIPVLLELDKHSRNGKKKEISDYVLNSAVNVSGANLGLLYRYEDKNKFSLVSHRGISQVEERKIKIIESQACHFLKALINKKKDKVHGLPKEAFHKCFKIVSVLEYFIILPLWKKMDKKTKGFILLGFKDDKNLDTSELEFYDVFSMHASAALLGAEVLK